MEIKDLIIQGRTTEALDEYAKENRNNIHYWSDKWFGDYASHRRFERGGAGPLLEHDNILNNLDPEMNLLIKVGPILFDIRPFFSEFPFEELSKYGKVKRLELENDTGKFIPIPEWVYDFKDLEDLVIFGEFGSISERISELNNLKYLEMNVTELTLPESIGELENLEALNIKYTAIKELPESLSGLENLRFLSLYGSYVERLPEGLCDILVANNIEKKVVIEKGKNLWNLVNLRGQYVIIEMPKNFINKISDTGHWKKACVTKGGETFEYFVKGGDRNGKDYLFCENHHRSSFLNTMGFCLLDSKYVAPNMGAFNRSCNCAVKIEDINFKDSEEFDNSGLSNHDILTLCLLHDYAGKGFNSKFNKHFKRMQEEGLTPFDLIKEQKEKTKDEWRKDKLELLYSIMSNHYM